MDSTGHAIEPFLRDVLVPVSAGWNIRVDDRAFHQFALYAAELVRWNERVNLTRITAPGDIVVRHFLDSLACARAFGSVPPSLIDVGTGAGFPGLPLKIIWPTMHLVLSDSIGKKTAFLRHIVAALELEDVEVVTARAEDLGRDPAHREQYAGVVARAVADLAVLSEYCLPLCRIGGRFVAPKSANGAEEAEGAGRAIGLLGGRLHEVQPVALPDLPPRSLIVVEKVRPTPGGLPRPPGVPGKQPL